MSKIESYYKYILLLLLSILIYRFIIYEHYPEHDEVISVTLLSSVKTSLIKFKANNHLLSTQLGNLIIYTFGLDLMKIRLVSFTCLLLILFMIQFYFKDYLKTFLFLLICLSVDIIITYYSLYRGYAISSLLFCYIFFLIITNVDYLKNLKKIYLISSILVFHNQSTLYLIIPILIVLTFNLLKSRDKNFFNLLKIPLYYFCFPLIFFILIFSFIEGVYASKIFIDFAKLDLGIEQITKNFFLILYSGFNNIFNNNFIDKTLFGSIDNFFSIIKSNYLFFSIFIFALIKSIYCIFFKKNQNLIDYIIFIFFICFVLINRNGPVRIYTGFASFFIIYLLKDLKLFFFKKNLDVNLIVANIFILIIFFKIANIEFIKVPTLKKQYLLYYENIADCNFPSIKKLTEFEKHLIYYTYLDKCKKKPDIDSFYKFYKS